MRQNCVTISNVNLERCIGQSFYHNTFHFDHIGFCQTLSLLVRLDFIAECRESPAKLTVCKLLIACYFFRKPCLLRGHKQHMSALFALWMFHFSGFTVRQQKELPLHRKNDEELSLVSASVGSDDI